MVWAGAAAAAEAPLEQSPPAEDPPTTVAPVEVNTSTVDEELRAALNIDEYSDVWREAPSSWAGYIQDVSVQGADVAVTLGISPRQMSVPSTDAGSASRPVRKEVERPSA